MGILLISKLVAELVVIVVFWIILAGRVQSFGQYDTQIVGYSCLRRCSGGHARFHSQKLELNPFF